MWIERQKRNIFSLSFSILFLVLEINGQVELVNKEKYPFIKYQYNKLVASDSNYFNPFFSNLSKLMKEGDNQINIIQIGDSHIQSDIFSNTSRNIIQDYIPGGGANARGFIFPYNMAKSNNPWNYKITYSGIWNNCKNLSLNCNCGLAGTQLKTFDKSSFINISQSQNSVEKNSFSKIRIYLENPESSYSLYVVSIPIAGTSISSENNEYIEYTFSKPVQSCNIFFNRRINTGEGLSLYGFSLLSDEPGITWHALGVNGTTLKAYSSCHRIYKEMQNLYPDLIIISLGTNDAYTTNFNQIDFRNTYENFIENLKDALPGTAIIMTTPGDCLFKRRYPNYNTQLAGKIIKDICQNKDIAYWDYFSVMGGMNSMRTWMKNGLAIYDGVHYQTSGYNLQSQLFMEALFSSYDQYLQSKKE